MKHAAYFLLLCGLVSSQVFGQSAPKQKPVVIRCVAFSCGSAPFIQARHEVRVGSFYSFPTMPFNHGNAEIKLGTFKALKATSLHSAHRQVSMLEKATATVAVSR